jgi:WD40 repeat protein
MVRLRPFFLALLCLLMALPALAQQPAVTPITADNAAQLSTLVESRHLQFKDFAWAPDSHAIAIATAVGVRVLLVADKLKRSELALETDKPTECVAYSPDGALLAGCNSSDATVWLWDAHSGKQLAAFTTGKGASVTRLYFSADGKRIAAVTRDLHHITLWGVLNRGRLETITPANVHKINRLATLKHPTLIGQASFSPDGLSLVSNTIFNPGGLYRWDLKTQQRVYFDKPYAEGNRALFSPDGKHLAIALGQQGVDVLDAATNAPLYSLPSPDGKGVIAIAYSPDSLLIAASYANDFIRLWDLTTQQIVATLQSPADYLETLKFSPDGSMLALVSASGVWVWSLGGQVNLPTSTPRPTRTPEPTLAPTVTGAELTPTAAPTLAAGVQAVVHTTGGDVLNVRNSPGKMFKQVGKLADGTRVTVLDGPRVVDNLWWWKIRTADGLEGWVVDRVDDVQTLVPG